MKVLVTGASGQLGTDVVTQLKRRGHEVIASDRNALDITDPAACQSFIEQFLPEAIIHCAAYTAVDRAETEVEAAYAINAAGTRNMVVASERIGAKFCYISTDYVFDGRSDTPYREYDDTNPQTIYGKSKRAGEQLVQTLSSRYFIVRTSWVFGLNGHNFVKTMLRLGQERDEIKVVHDQKGSPTYTPDLAEFLIQLILTEQYGIYHASNSDTCTWYEFASKIFAEAAEILNRPLKAELIPCTTEEFPLPAPRPANSVMEHLSIRNSGFKDLRSWKEGLQDFLQQYLKK